MAMWENMSEWYLWRYEKSECQHSWLGWDGWVEPAIVKQSARSKTKNAWVEESSTWQIK